MRLSLKKKLFIPYVSLFVAAALFLFFFCRHTMTELAETQTIDRLKAIHSLAYSSLDNKYPGAWRIADGKIFKGERLMNAETEFVDHVKALTGAGCTIFQGAMRVATNIIKDDGSRAVGTEAAKEVSAAVLSGGSDYVGEAQVVGKPYQVHYSPIKDGNGTIIGMFFAGVSKHEVAEHMRSILWGIVVAFAVVTVLAVLLSLGMGRAIGNPVEAATTELGTAISQVNSACTELATANQTLAQMSSEQAASLQKTTESVGHLNARTKQNADSAQAANTIAQTALKAAEKGGSSVTDLHAAMQAVSTSSNSVGAIIRTIEEISFQTNLLALNAAVEAARAGEHGKGFGVVAEEVRNLANRAAAAAQQSAQLVKENVSKAESGFRIAATIAEDFQKIQDSAKNVASIVAEIAMASREQASGIDEISRAVSEMDAAVQQNAAAAEEGAATSEELSAQAAAIGGVVGKLNETVQGA